jgi:large subunit ribosomal protein L5
MDKEKKEKKPVKEAKQDEQAVKKPAAKKSADKSTDKKSADKKPADKKSEKKEVYVEEKVPVRLKEVYWKEIVPVLSKKYNYSSPLQVPQLKKISVNVGLGAATQDPKIVETVAKDLENIVGQKPVITKAKKSVSNFKLREGMKIGCKVTLRKARMYEFLDKLINITIPRIRDFKGIPDKAFDGNGNYTLGIKEHIIFPEINIDNVSKAFGMDVTFVTTAKTDDEAFELLKSFGMPFVKRQAS